MEASLDAVAALLGEGATRRTRESLTPDDGAARGIVSERRQAPLRCPPPHQLPGKTRTSEVLGDEEGGQVRAAPDAVAVEFEF